MVWQRVKHTHKENKICPCDPPRKGLMKIWDWLEECYGALEVIKEALFNWVEDFAMLSSRNFLRLREYGDLLTELLSVKEDGNRHDLTYLDTAQGFHPLLAMLPFLLQEK